MECSDYIRRIKLQLTGNVLESELKDEDYEQIINELALPEINKYYNATKLVPLPAGSCIDLNEFPDVNTVVAVYRQAGIASASGSDTLIDPVQYSQLEMYSFGNSSYSTAWMYNYGLYATAQRIANTMSTDLAFKQDRLGNKLYINLAQGQSNLTMEYIPKLKDASDIVGDHWIDMLTRVAVAYSKLTLGRIRTRYTQANAQWTGDGATILEEGKNELADLRAALTKANDYFTVVD